MITSDSVVFKPHSQVRYIKRLGLVGMGEAVRTKIWPALKANDYPLDGIVVCSREPRSELKELPHLYHPVEPESLLPLDFLDEHGFLSRDTLWIVAAPSEFHPLYTLQLVGLCRVAVEKPIAATLRQARLLLPLAHNKFDIWPIDHKLYNASPLALVDACRNNPNLLEGVRRIEGLFYERAGISKGRQQEDCIADVQWHLFTIMMALFRAAGTPFEVTVDRVWVSTHEPDPQGHFATPTVWTASRIQGHLVRDRQEITYDFCQAKAAPKNEKFVRLFGEDEGEGGVPATEISLNETGWQAHGRVLDELVKPTPGMCHTLTDAIGEMELIDTARRLACEEPAYPFGELPGFLCEV